MCLDDHMFSGELDMHFPTHVHLRTHWDTATVSYLRMTLNVPTSFCVSDLFFSFLNDSYGLSSVGSLLARCGFWWVLDSFYSIHKHLLLYLIHWIKSFDLSSSIRAFQHTSLLQQSTSNPQTRTSKTCTIFWWPVGILSYKRGVFLIFALEKRCRFSSSISGFSFKVQFEDLAAFFDCHSSKQTAELSINNH